VREDYHFKDGQFTGVNIRANYRLLLEYDHTKYQAGIKAVLAKFIKVDLDPELSWVYAIWSMFLRWTDYGRRQ